MGIGKCPSCFFPQGQYKNVAKFSGRRLSKNCDGYDDDDDDEYVCQSDSSGTGKFKKLHKLKSVLFGGQKRVVFFGPEFQKRYDRERKLRVKKKDLSRCRGMPFDYNIILIIIFDKFSILIFCESCEN